jgi:catechol 2,3-dioxygenase-like lactoylglutathione lyase family enzyme
MPPRLNLLDHLVLTVSNLDRTIEFYRDVLGMEPVKFGTPPRYALQFGQQKINLHQAGQEFEPKANLPSPGSGDLCFLSETPLSDWQVHLNEKGVLIEEGPVARTGAQGPITSIYLRDPDENLIEISNAMTVQAI